MATIVLQTVGAAVGSFLGGPIGAAVGQTLGAIGGSYIDQQLFGSGGETITGPRLESAQILSSQEGATIPRVFGRARISGEVIWATRFEEVQSVQSRSQGGKGGAPKTTVRSFSYFANFAIGLCEGKIGGIGRIWVDGKLLSQPGYTIRTYTGDEEQLPDSLIEAKQGSGNAPAYRGLAYVVFENFPLEDYGNRIPQIAVEVIRPVGTLEKNVHAVNMIPGATEFGYDTEPFIEQANTIENSKLNVHQSIAETDFLASLDALIAACPNLKQISLVVAWFGDDLRAGHCTIRPRVEVSTRTVGWGNDWSVAGLSRSEAQLVSYHQGSPALGGTPCDASVVRAIEAIRQRGLKVGLNPFVMMDIPENSGLPDPYGGVQQAAYPWRGRITCDPAFGLPGTVDGTSAASNQVEAFVSEFQHTQIVDLSENPFNIFSGELSILDLVKFLTGTASGLSASGPGMWSYRHMILHYAKLAELAGGVDIFLIGSEMRGLTSVRGANETFPFVDALSNLATDVSGLLGPDCLVTYGADWSEYFGYQPSDGSQNVYYNLDPLWTNPAIGAIGIDNYMPISDWRPGGDPDGLGRTSSDIAMLQSQIAAGEGYDWYYADEEARVNGQRTAITDGLNKPWVYRYKDIVSWWSEQHFDRRNGLELATPSPWLPRSKPVVFTEFGCPAVHNGAVQPNVFYDPKSSESALPYFSNGSRDDQAQANYILALQNHWSENSAEFNADNNPVSSMYDGRMVDFEKSQLWAWDARPYPAFPQLDDVWRDAENWHFGHWLNGRLGSLRLADLIGELMLANGLENFDVSRVSGVVDGYVIADASSARNALEALMLLFDIIAYEDAGIIYFQSRGRDARQLVPPDEMVQEQNGTKLSKRREQDADLPVKLKLFHIDPENDYEQTDTSVALINQKGTKQQSISAPLVIGHDRSLPILEAHLHDRWTGRESVVFGLSNAKAEVVVGDELQFEAAQHAQIWRVMKVESGVSHQITARAVENNASAVATAPPSRKRKDRPDGTAIPFAVFMDLPTLGGANEDQTNQLAVSASPWPGSIAVYASPTKEGFSYRQTVTNSAFIGELVAPMNATVVTSRWNRQDSLTVKLYSGSLSSASTLEALNGENALAIRCDDGTWEIVQFLEAELIAEKTWRISHLLRGQAGTEPQALWGAAPGARVVALNSAVVPLENSAAERGLELNWLVGPTGVPLDAPEISHTVFEPGYAGLRPYSPAHLSAVKLPTGELSLSWVRRNRLAADDWRLAEIPMSEEKEAYQIVLTSTGGNSMSLLAAATHQVVPATDLADAFGTDPAEIEIAVSQLSSAVGPGPSSKITITI